MNPAERLLINSINLCLGKKEAQIFEYEENLYGFAIKIAEEQDLLPMFANAVFQSGISVPPKVFDRLLSSAATSVSRYENQKMCLDEVSDIFEKNGIDYLTMKGTEIRRFYPSPEMRTSSDIDILIRKKDVSRADELLREAGYKLTHGGPHDTSYLSPANAHIEVHYQLFDEGLDFYEDFADIWDRAIPAGDNEHHFIMTPDDAYIYIVVHMLKHFKNSNAGARNILDVYLLRKNTELSEDYISKNCSKMGAEKFRKGIERLAWTWFGDGEEGDFEREFGEYILRNGIYGSVFSKVALLKTEKEPVPKNKFRRILFMVFRPYRLMKKTYPSIEKFPPLILVFWVWRWLRIFSRKSRQYFKAQQKVQSKLDTFELGSMEEILRELELYQEKK